MVNRQTSLWMGDLEQYMDENFVRQAFLAMGESPSGVRIIAHKITGGSAGYCFVELADEASVDSCIQKLNGKGIPGSNPPRNFKLNFASHNKRSDAGLEFSVFVGDLPSDANDYQLHQIFKKYSSCKGAKVVTDQYGYSRGYGFVNFGEESEQKKAIEECQGTTLGGKALTLSIALAKSQKTLDTRNLTQNYQSNYIQTPYSGMGQGYYSQWGGYGQYSGYNNGGYNGGYNYNYGPYGYPPHSHMMPPPPPLGMPPTSADMTGGVEVSHEDTGDGNGEGEDAEVAVEECDVEQWNKDFMQRSEELYNAMMDCHWEPLDSFDSAIPLLS
ncbi:tRNA selenocysteine 1-associated protein 1-like [Nerophis lumbriciformis]|uniref:tRNA selenocysteine 1-associated protein 1-like n=1 Tax=Nerophis lumbriciformis TaxID=546530 RepID=UPI002ADFDCAE|nr:tRNA selenocysteine 1-associated protein 1-like [Nerophis lumbriciformis]